MPIRRNRQEDDLYRKIKWLIFLRTLIGAVLFFSAMVATGPRNRLFLADESLFFLMVIAVGVIVLSLVYLLALARVKRLVAFAYVQIILDTCVVTLFIFVTGSFGSIFTFLYLVVIIYATMLIYRRGGMVAATLCALQYGIMIDLEYFGLISPVGVAPGEMITNYRFDYVLYKLTITIGACYSVAFLSGFLSEQEKRAKHDLWAMEDQMKRVERLAAVGEMAAGLTHEIKNPLASLSGSIQMLKETIPYDRAHDKLMRIVLREADRLNTLVTSFLIFSRPQVGNLAEVRLDNVIEEVVSLFRKDPVCQNRVDIQTVSPAMHFIKIDPEHLSQVLWNLLKNAAEAIDAKGTVAIAVSPERKGYVKIVIEDNGVGIPPENLESIFDPFFSTKPKGTGLGLSIVQQIVGLYGGLIHVESEPGQGTRLIMKLKNDPFPEKSDPISPGRRLKSVG